MNKRNISIGFCRIFLIQLFSIFLINNIIGQSNDDCLTCHEDPTLTTTRQGKTYSMFVNRNLLMSSVHKDVECASCHPDAAVDEFPHPETLAPVDCGFCHDEAMKEFERGIHGQALKLNALYAPDCM
jgi:hypothetical protein